MVKGYCFELELEELSSDVGDGIFSITIFDSQVIIDSIFNFNETMFGFSTILTQPFLGISVPHLHIWINVQFKHIKLSFARIV